MIGMCSGRKFCYYYFYHTTYCPVLAVCICLSNQILVITDELSNKETSLITT